MMKNIGLSAVTYKDNFGSCLQTYATQYTLEKMGYDVHIFEIKGVFKQINIKKSIYYVGRLFDPVEFKYLMANLKSRSRKAASLPTDDYAKEMQERKKVYDDFRNKWNHMLPIANSWKELRKQASEMDAVVVGSDQLWRPSNIVGSFFTLEFVPDDIKKVSFSTSIGVPELPNNLHKHAKKFMSRFQHISVRENTAADIVKDMCGKEAKVLCDPTMMLTAEQWMEVQDKKPFTEGKYILTYFMGDNPEHREFAKRLREKTGYKIVALLHGATYIPEDEEYPDEKPFNVGPSEFMNLIRNAEYICTDSFHGCVFCILNQKKFFTFRRWPDGSKFSANDRIYTLLDWTGLQDRMLNGDEDISLCITKEIDYNDVLERVAAKRKEAKDYLTNALNS